MSHLGEVIGTAGRRYLFKQLIQHKPASGVFGRQRLNLPAVYSESVS